MRAKENPNRSWSKRRLRLDRLVDGNNCAAIYQDKHFKCHWREQLGKKEGEK